MDTRQLVTREQDTREPDTREPDTRELDTREMAVEPVISVPGLLSLPQELLLDIGEYLCPRDLLSLSEVCHHLRTAFNVNSLWRKHTRGGQISRGFNPAVSLVEPKFQVPYSSSFEPLCEQRLQFLKQSRLLNNIRKGKFVEHSMEFDGCQHLPGFDPGRLLKVRKIIIYGDKYLFTVSYINMISIFDIEVSPKYLLTVNLESNLPCKIYQPWVQVVGDKLVVEEGNWLHIFDIKMPESIDISYSINVDTFGTQMLYPKLFIGKLLFVENSILNVVHVWDLSTGDQCRDLCPKISGPNLNIIGYSVDEKLIILAVGMDVEEPSDPHVFVYSIESQDFLPFMPVLNEESFQGVKYYGLINSDFVVLLIKRSIDEYCIFVFDLSKSSLLAKRSFFNTVRIKDAKIVAGYLVLPSLVSVVIMSLKTLQTVWELKPDADSTPSYQSPPFVWIKMEKVFHISSLDIIIVIYKASGVELWDFHTRKKCLDIPTNDIVLMNDMCTKLVFYDSLRMVVRSFW